MGERKYPMDKKALVVVTNHSDFEHAKAEPTGLWLSELTHFYDEFEKAEKLRTRKAGEPHPFVAPEEFQEFLASLVQRGKEKLKRERGRK